MLPWFKLFIARKKSFLVLIGVALQTIFKMDRYGNGEEMMLDKIFDSAASTPSFKNFDKELLTGELLVLLEAFFHHHIFATEDVKDSWCNTPSSSKSHAPNKTEFCFVFYRHVCLSWL